MYSSTASARPRQADEAAARFPMRAANGTP
jgi:hypothetical protein